MAEISPPTTVLRPTGTPLGRSATFDIGTSRSVVIGASSGSGGGFVGKRENPPLPRGVP